MKRFTIQAGIWCAAAACFLIAGCGRAEPKKPSAGSGHAAASNSDHSHAHSHAHAPHDGTIADWGGGKYHVEFTVDHDKREATVYILGEDAKSPVAIPAAEIQLTVKDPSMQVALKAVPQAGDPEGSASRFSGNHESLSVVREYAGTITGVIDDTPYTADFEEKPHDHTHP